MVDSVFNKEVITTNKSLFKVEPGRGKKLNVTTAQTCLITCISFRQKQLARMTSDLSEDDGDRTVTSDLCGDRQGENEVSNSSSVCGSVSEWALEPGPLTVPPSPVNTACSNMGIGKVFHSVKEVYWNRRVSAL